MKKYTLPLYLQFRQFQPNSLIRSTATAMLALSLGFLPICSAMAQMDGNEGDLESVMDQVETNAWSSQDAQPYVMSQPNAIQKGVATPQPGFFSQSASQSPEATALPKGSPKGFFRGKKETAKGGAKKSLWPFKAKPRETPAPSMESIVNVGPRETVASSDILFRLPLPILGRQGMMEPGFYLARPQNTSPEGMQLSIYQRSQLMVTVSVRPKGAEHPDTPVTQLPAKPQAPLTPSVEAKSQPDQEAIVILLKAGGMVYESQPIPVVER